MDTSSARDPDIVTPHRRATSESVAAIRESVGEIVRSEKERVQDALEHGKERARGLERRFESYVREHPLQTVLYAAGAGVLLGWLLGRRR